MKTVQIADAGYAPELNGNGKAAAKESAAVEKAAGEKETGKAPQIKEGAVFAGSLKLMTMDRVERRRNQAREQAARLIRDQFASDNRLTDILEEQRELVKKLGPERSEKLDEVLKYENKQAGLMEKYAITQDCQEQKDLDLRREAIRLQKQHRLGDLSDEKLERLISMGPVTEYQKRSLDLDELLESSMKLLENIDRETRIRGQVIGDVQRGMLAQSGMTSAQKASDRILDAASKEMIGMITEEAKKHVDEKLKELIEEAKEAAEKKKTEEKRKDKAEDAQKEQDGLADKAQESVSLEENIEEEIQKILDQAKLLLEERKGLVISAQV